MEWLVGTDVPLVVEAHTGSMRAASCNRELSERRAATVVETLVELGVPANRLTAEAAPVADNDTPESRAANRPVEFRVQQQGD